METRRKEMVNFVNQMGEVNFDTLKKRFPDVSEVTLRKDLKALDESKRLIRIYGGAKAIGAAYTSTMNYYARNVMNSKEKKIIAQKAVKILEPNSSLYLAAGSTCSAIAQELPDIPLKIFTDGLETAINLSKRKSFEVTILGGQTEVGGMQTVGPVTLKEAGELCLDYAFCGTLGYTVGYGFHCFSEHTLALAKMLNERARRLIIVMDSSKIEKANSPYNLEEKYIDMLITDGMLDKETVMCLEHQNVKVL